MTTGPSTGTIETLRRNKVTKLLTQDTGRRPASPPHHPAIVLAGPTASGKSALALAVAEAFDGEIVNYDSVQLYRYLDIGTAKPSAAERRRVPHHLIDILEPDQRSSAGEFQRRARSAIREIASRGRIPVLAGGTGLYLRAALEGLFDAPQRSEYWRQRLRDLDRERGPGHLHRILARLDPDSASRIAARDTPKIVRALEVLFQTGRPLSVHLKERPRRPLEGFSFIFIGLNPNRELLYQRIAERAADMFDRGLVEEVGQLTERGISTEASAFHAIGYRQALQCMGGIISLHEAIMSTERETRRYAKRQLTWFRRQHRIVWFDGFGGDRETQRRVHRFLRHALGGSATPAP